MEARLYFGMAIQGGHERRVGALGHLGEDGREVSCRLVLVENQRHAQAIGHFFAFYRRIVSDLDFVRLAYG